MSSKPAPWRAWLAVVGLVGLSTVGLSAPASAADPRGSAGGAEHAVHAGHPGHAAHCRDTVSASGISGRGTTSRAHDHAELSGSELVEVEHRLERLSALDGTQQQSSDVSVPVHVHVIDGTSYRGPSKAEVVQQLGIMNTAFAGGQSEQASASQFTFRLASFHRVRNQRWLTAGLNRWNEPDADSREMRSRLHVGGKAALNMYLSKPGDGLLGYSSFPFGGRLAQDGVTVHSESLPGGAQSGYNRGDTAVHEVGHWLGLYHTFQGRCGRQNDMVGDTPKEYRPSFACPRGRDTCDAPGLDPIRNFMDYSYDSCMNMFTTGQVNRMATVWQAYRAP